MTTTINASTSSGLVSTADTSGIIKLQSNGVATNALAWVNFNGTTSPGTIRSQYNVSSVTKNGTGDYTVNFTTAMSDANYSVAGSVGGTNASYCFNLRQTASLTTTSCSVSSVNPTIILADSAYVCVQIFGN